MNLFFSFADIWDALLSQEIHLMFFFDYTFFPSLVAKPNLFDSDTVNGLYIWQYIHFNCHRKTLKRKKNIRFHLEKQTNKHNPFRKMN